MDKLPAFRIYRVSNVFKEMEEKHLEAARAAIALGRQLLVSIPPPDTFLGRKSQEPFPNEGDL